MATAACPDSDNDPVAADPDPVPAVDSFHVTYRNLGDGLGRINLRAENPDYTRIVSGAELSATSTDNRSFGWGTGPWDVTHTAEPSAGSTFVRWGEPCPGSTVVICMLQVPDTGYTWTVEAEFALERSEVRWTGTAGTTDWFTAANWSPSRVPEDDDDVVIALAGAVVDVDESTSIRSLTHSAGTLRIVEPGNCANCVLFDVEEGIASSGTGTLLVAERSIVRFGEASSFVKIQGGADNTDAVGIIGDFASSPGLPLEVVIQEVEGSFYFSFVDVEITIGGAFTGGAVTTQNGSTLTIGAGATVEVDGFGDGIFGGGLGESVVVAGTLRVLSSEMTFSDLTVASGGILEVRLARFRFGTTSHGTIRGVTVGTVQDANVTFEGTAPVVLESGSLLVAALAAFRAPSTVRGTLETFEAEVAGDADWPFVLEDASLADIEFLGVGPGEATIRFTSDASFGELTSSLSFGQGAPPIVIDGAPSARLTLGILRLRQRGLIGGATGGRLAVTQAIFDGTSGPTPDNIELDILGPPNSQITGSAGQFGPALTGRNGARVIQRGPLRLSNAVVSPPPGGSELRQFYFEHRGELIPGSGASIVRGCIVAGGGTIAAGTTPTATITLQPLASSEC